MDGQLDLHTGKLHVRPGAFREGVQQMVRPEQYSGLAYELPTQTHAYERLMAGSSKGYDIDSMVGGLEEGSLQQRENFALGNHYSYFKDGSDTNNQRRTDAVGLIKESSLDLQGGTDKPQSMKRAGFFH